MNFLSKILLTAWVAIGSLFGYQAPQQQPVSYGSFNPTGGATYRLQSSISSTQTTITLASFKEPISNIPYTMSYLNSDIMYGTIDPQNSTIKEFISFTGITQNSNGTATLTGVTRGLGFSYPYTASTTLRQAHSGQAIFILSNTPQFYNQYYSLANVSTSTNVLIFSSTTPPRYDSVAGQAAGTYIATTSELVSWAGLQAVAIAGSANATEIVKGITELATQSEMSESSLTGGTGASLSLYSKYSTSSPAFTTGNYIPITRSSDNKLSPLFIATSSTDAYTFVGPMSFASSTFTATTTIAASSLTNGAFRLNGLAYIFPSSRGASGSVLSENGSGTLSWSPITVPRYSYATSSVATTTSAGCSNCSQTKYATTTPTNVFTIPAGTLNASSTISVKANGTCANGSMTGTGQGSCYLLLRTSTGQTIWEGGVSGTSLGNYGLTVDTIGLNSASSQMSSGVCSDYYDNNSSSSSGMCSGINSTSAIDFTQSLSLVMVIRASASAGPGDTGTISSAGITNYSIIVNP